GIELRIDGVVEDSNAFAGLRDTSRPVSLGDFTDIEFNDAAYGTGFIGEVDWIRVGTDPPDADSDGVPDHADNCVAIPNPSQLDSNQDGYGNACDADYNNDGAVGAPDFVLLRGGFGKHSGDPGFAPDLDANGDGAIGALDFLL